MNARNTDASGLERTNSEVATSEPESSEPSSERVRASAARTARRGCAWCASAPPRAARLLPPRGRPSTANTRRTNARRRRGCHRGCSLPGAPREALGAPGGEGAPARRRRSAPTRRTRAREASPRVSSPPASEAVCQFEQRVSHLLASHLRGRGSGSLPPGEARRGGVRGGAGESRPGRSAANTVPTRTTCVPTSLRNAACDPHKCASARVAGKASASYFARRCASTRAARLSASVGGGGSSSGSSSASSSFLAVRVPPTSPSASAFEPVEAFVGAFFGGIALGASSSSAKSASRTFAFAAFSARRGFASGSAVFSSPNASRIGANVSGATGVSSSGAAISVRSLAATDFKSTSPSGTSSSAAGSSPSSGSFVASAGAPSAPRSPRRRIRSDQALAWGFSFAIAAAGATRAERRVSRGSARRRLSAHPATRRGMREATTAFVILRETVTASRVD